MKKYIIAFFLFCISLFLIDNSYAATITGWGYNVPHPSLAQLQNCGSSNCSTDVSTVSESITSVAGGEFYYRGNSDISMTANGTGVMWIIKSPISMAKGYMYTATTYICHNKNTNLVFKASYSNNGITQLKNKSYLNNTFRGVASTNLNITPYEGSYSKCGYITDTFTAPELTTFYALNYTIDSTLSGYRPTLIGFDIEVIGKQGEVTKQEVQDIINNSNLASASSVEEVKRAQAEIKTELQNTQSAIDNQTQQQAEQHRETMDTITDSDSTDATNDASGFFEGFTTDTFGLTSIITAPLNLIKSITSSTCAPLTLSLPYINQNVSIPCMTEIYRSYFGGFLTVYQVITFGLVSYWVCVHVFRMVKDFKNPDHDEIEVVDL